MKFFSRSILSVLAISLLVSCSDGERQETPTPTPSQAEDTATPAETQGGTATPSPAPTAEPETTPTQAPTPTPTPDPALTADADHDGWSISEGDCDDSSDAISPEGKETCDGIDQDCDGFADEYKQTWLWVDADGDGDGSSLEGTGYYDGNTMIAKDVSGSIYGCAEAIPAGYAVPMYYDCDDRNAEINHLAADESADGIDQNCNEVDGQ